MRRISKMNSKFSDTLIVNLRVINNTAHELKRIEGTHSGREGSFPPEFSAHSRNVFQFHAAPHFKGDILIEYGVKKPFFETRFAYRLAMKYCSLKPASYTPMKSRIFISRRELITSGLTASSAQEIAIPG